MRGRIGVRLRGLLLLQSEVALQSFVPLLRLGGDGDIFNHGVDETRNHAVERECDSRPELVLDDRKGVEEAEDEAVAVEVKTRRLEELGVQHVHHAGPPVDGHELSEHIVGGAKRGGEVFAHGNPLQFIGTEIRPF